METFKYEYLKKDERVDGTSVTVTGLDSKETYFWQVATVKDGMQSAYSDQSTIKITKQAPETYQPTDYDGTQFTASWEDLGEGSQYKLSVYSISTEELITKKECLSWSRQFQPIRS